MEHPTPTTSNLPENAYRELKPGEVYRPIMSHEYNFPEATVWSVFWGLLMAVIFSAAAAYSGLKIGQVMEAAIPISIIAVGISTAARIRKPLGQNVIIQSIGASSGVIVAGAVFTIPALYILKLDVNFFKIFIACMLGGFLGILFLIPFRKYFVKDMHGKFPFPEATAINEILVTGEKGGNQALVLVTSGLIGGLYDFMASALGLWKETFTSRVLPYGESIANEFKMLFQLNISAMIFGFGYLIGLRFSTIITVGSLLSWFVFVPLVGYIAQLIPGSQLASQIAAMSPENIFTKFVRPIGIGAIAMAGIIGILRSSKVIVSAFSLAFGGIFGKSKIKHEEEVRTQKDLKMNFVMLYILLTIIAIFIFMLAGVGITFWQAVAALLTVTIIAFLFTTVAANAIAIVGTNPVSGMTLMTLILSSFILSKVGLTGNTGLVSALAIGTIVCTALSMSGGFITDLKVGYWLGSTPVKQQSWKFLGTLVSAATVGIVIFMLSQSYGFTKEDCLVNQAKFTKSEFASIAKSDSTVMKKYKGVLDFSAEFATAQPAGKELMQRYNKELEKAEPLVAPQANAMAAVIKPLMLKEEDAPWVLYLIGAVISILLYLLELSPLAFALGMYLPLPLNTPLIVGGLINHLVSKSKKGEKVGNARNQRGTLIASGFMAGAAIFGVIGAVILFFFNKGIQIFPEWTEVVAGKTIIHDAWNATNGAEVLSIVMFAVLILYFVWDIMKAKVED
ncbi:MAG: family oligopeptide transporter [Ignavibacteria bacterium]|nr:family oligopeptide transporter [Ignavibacteria bacterium]